MHNRFHLQQLLSISLTSLSLVAFVSHARADQASGTKWKVSKATKPEAKAAAKSGSQPKVAAKLPAKVLSKTTTAQAKTSVASKRSPASVDAGSSASSAPSDVAAGGNPDMPLTASPTSSALASAIPQKLAAIDPNSAVEIRGQARTLSMMLVLKNGKDSINFIKVRKDYRSEIAKTEY